MKLNLVFAIGLCIAASAIAKPTSKLIGALSRRENVRKVTGERGRIVDGNPATTGQFPWHVAVSNGNFFVCAGSLISLQAVLTTAYCVEGKDSLVITVGTLFYVGGDTGSQTQISRNLIIHERFDPMLRYDDVGLALLDSPFTVSETIIPIRLPTADQLENTFEGYPATVSGWGWTDISGEANSYILLYTNQTITSNLKCEDDYGGYVHASNICSVGNPTGTLCNGDSGGGLAIQDTDGKFTLVGIATTGNCVPGTAFMFARVTSFVSWINEHVTI